MKGGIVTDNLLSMLSKNHDSSDANPATADGATASGGSNPSSTVSSGSSTDGNGIVLVEPQQQQIMSGNLKALLGLAIFSGIAAFLFLFLLGWYIRRKIKRRHSTRREDIELADRNGPKRRNTNKRGGLLASTWARWRGGLPKRQGEVENPPLPTEEQIRHSQMERRAPEASSVYSS